MATLAQSFPELTPTIIVSTGVEFGTELVEQLLTAGKAGKQYKLLKYQPLSHIMSTYRRAYTVSPTQRFLPGHDWQKLLRGRRTTFLAPILSPACVDGSAAKTVPRTRTSWPARKRKLGWLNSTHYNITIFYTLLHNKDFFDLHSTPQADFQSTVKSILGFIIPLFPRLLLQQHVSSIQVENFRYSLLIIFLFSPR